jgi:hypothetical protein
MNRKRRLTEKQQRFVDQYLIDLNGTRAYKSAYPAVKKDATASQAASRMLRNVKVQVALAVAQRRRQERTEINQDMVIKDLLRIARKAEEAERYGDALRAIEMLAKHLRMFDPESVNLNLNTPPVVNVVFTKPQKQIDQHGSPALGEGLKIGDNQCQCSNPQCECG